MERYKIKKPGFITEKSIRERNYRDCIAKIVNNIDMDKTNFEILFSKERLNKYFLFFSEDSDKAVSLYKANIQLSQALYPLLSIIEISLRNSINRAMSNYFHTNDWFDKLLSLDNCEELNREIIDAKYKITKRKENINSGKITAELTFGFWTKLFNAKYELQLWKPLRLSFPNMPKSLRQRHRLSAPINRIRNLRNRIYHYEPIIWHIETVEKQIAECYDLLNWINADLVKFAQEFDSIHIAINKINEIYSWRNY